MKKLITIYLVCVVVFGLSNWVSANILPLPTKWTQMPDTVTGTCHGSMKDFYIAADDYVCQNPLPVTNVHWWGSYWNPSPGSPQPINGFTIRFFSDVPASPGQFSRPGDLLCEAYVAGNCNETYFGYSNYYGINVYQYDVVLSEPFEQELGTTYWLSIQVDLTLGAPPYWGWHTSSDHWNDNAVQACGSSPWDWNILGGQDLAFELTVIPEPATIAILSLGALGLIRRKK